MPEDPIEEWRRLTTLYNEMGDIEIRELAAQINDLVPTAQQILRDELKKRGMSLDPSTTAVPRLGVREARVSLEPASYRHEFSEPPAQSEGLTDYTWKVPLCECETTVQARALAEALRRAGIDTWIDGVRSNWTTGGPRLLVGADQLDEARVIAAQPIPQDVIDDFSDAESAAAYELPSCPRCKSPDPTLESVEPSNNWLCESCGYTWSDPVPNDSP